MPKIQLCRNGCGGYIIVQEDPASQKWKPYDCDDAGNPIDLHKCPNNPYFSSSSGGGQQQRQKPQESSFSSRSPPITTTAGGGTLDTKRILQTLVELTTQVRELKNIVDSRTIIDTSKYEGLNNQLYNALAEHINEAAIGPASKLLIEPKDRQSIINDQPLTRHSDKADEYERTKQFADDENTTAASGADSQD